MAEPTKREIALLLMLNKIISDRVAAGRKQLTAEAEKLFEPGDREVATLGGKDGKLGKVLRYEAGGRAHITDEPAFLRWVNRHYPEQTEVIVRPAFRRALLNNAREIGEPVDPKTGEIVPGLAVEPPGWAGFQVRPDDEAADKVAARLAEELHRPVGGVLRGALAEILAPPPEET